jgi:hypothetical protein
MGRLLDAVIFLTVRQLCALGPGVAELPLRFGMGQMLAGHEPNSSMVYVRGKIGKAAHCFLVEK